MIIKCKMCGGDMELSPEQRTGTCEYCGSTMTLPKVDDDQRAAAFNRGNHFRRIGEFDKALSVYESIVREDEKDAEAHWCCALCRFGIEYVKDPASGEYLPTCHRASFDSFLEDVDYKAAVEYADVVARRQYQRDGEAIAQVQRGILSISQKEQPFDVFLCYKESDERGNRTVDSTLAQDIYYQLTEQGRRVFFARITLEDKAGQEYEPYIFAALHSAKVMVVVGTRPEYLNAVWVKNEWSRYLALMKQDRKRLLIPCYRDMDPYDLPEQLSVLQSYDMSRIGFIQDLIRGISKVLDVDKKPETKVVERVIEHGSGGAAPGVDSLMKRAYLFMEDGDFDSANEYLNRVLDIDPNYAPAYAARTCTTLRFRKEEQLGRATFLYTSNPDWKKALRFADEKQKEVYESYEKNTAERVKRQIRDYTYDCAMEYAVNPALSEDLAKTLNAYTNSCKETDSMRRCNGLRRANYKENEAAFLKAVSDNEPGDVREEAYKTAAKLFQMNVDAGRDAESAERAKQCLALAEQARQKKIYVDAVPVYTEANQRRDVKIFLKAAEVFETIPDFRDAASRARDCRAVAARIQGDDYYAARSAMNQAGTESRKWWQAYSRLKVPNLDGYMDVEELRVYAEGKLNECREREERVRKQKEKKEQQKRNRQMTIACAAVGLIIICIAVYVKVIDPAMKYQNAESLLAAGEYEAAAEAFAALGDYSDASEMVLETKYREAESLLAAGKYEAALEAFAALGDYSDASEMVLEMKYKEAESLLAAGEYEAASEAFAALGEYSDAVEMTQEAKYKGAESLLEAEEYDAAYAAFVQMRGYKDVDTLLKENVQLREGREAMFAVGKTVTFGTYEQDGNTSNGQEKIEWIVLDRDGENALLLSKYGLDAIQFHSSYTDATWANSSLREWLNSTFINTAFSDEEQLAIQTTEVDNSKKQGYSKYDTSGGNDTQDKVFLLSYKEAFEEYFSSDESRICKPTAYAKSQGAYTNDAGNCYWWLRSPGLYLKYAAVVSSFGSLDGPSVDSGYNCIRPALWINLESDIF